MTDSVILAEAKARPLWAWDAVNWLAGAGIAPGRPE
jgi:hypothetical protein